MAKSLWLLNQADLESGRLISSDCPECKGTGRILWTFAGNSREEDCDCVCRARASLDAASFPERFSTKTLADLRWPDLTPSSLGETIQSFAGNLECAWQEGVGLVLFGNAGTGKTHVAVGMGKLVCALGYSLTFVTVADWLEALRSSYDGGQAGKTAEQQWKHLQEREWLILDDLGLESETAWVREKIYQVINRRWLGKLPTIVTTNRTPEDLSRRYGEGVVSRLWGSNLVLHFKGEDYRQKERSNLLAKYRSNQSQTSHNA